MPSGFVNDPKHWRDRAAEMRALAKGASDLDTEVIMLRLARRLRGACRSSGDACQRCSGPEVKQAPAANEPFPQGPRATTEVYVI